jgi:hypothetical protein
VPKRHACFKERLRTDLTWLFYRVSQGETESLSTFTGDGSVTDIQLFGTHAPTCPWSNDHESFDMSFSVTIGGTVFNISTVQHIDRGNFSGVAKVDASITTP